MKRKNGNSSVQVLFIPLFLRVNTQSMKKKFNTSSYKSGLRVAKKILNVEHFVFGYTMCFTLEIFLINTYDKETKVLGVRSFFRYV